MSRSLDIFVSSTQRLEEFVLALEKVLGVKFAFVEDSHEPFYRFWLPPVHITAGTHRLENDRDLNFESYPYDISVYAYRVGKPEEWIKAQDELGRYIFEKLKAQGNYRLMLVDDVQTKLDEFTPEPRQNPPAS